MSDIENVEPGVNPPAEVIITQRNVYTKIPALLQATRLTVSDLSYLVNVSRPTVYNWLNQTTTPRGKKKQRLDIVLRSLHNAYKIGVLPFPVKPLNAKMRKQALTEIIGENAQAS